MTKRRLRPVLIALLSIYLFVYPWSVLLVSLDRVPVWGSWMGGALLILQGTLVGGWLVANYGRHGLLASLLILLSTWLIEHIGTTTGFPFGAYQYTDVLLPKVVGVVPLAIPFAWLLVVPTSLVITERLVHAREVRNGQLSASPDKPKMLLKVLGAASFAVLLDVTIEPVSVHVSGYWEWYDVVGGYYGVPLSNFVSWWVMSVLLGWLLLVFQRKARARQKATETTPADGDNLAQDPWEPLFPWLPPLLYMLNLMMFVLVNISHGQKAPAFIGVVILGYLGIPWLKPRIERRLQSASRRKTLVIEDEG
jgi:putative membrane protein